MTNPNECPIPNYVLNAKDRKIYNRESLILSATELVSKTMKESNLGRSDLAKRLNKSKSHITQLLSGEKNMTLKTLANLMTAMGEEVEIVLKESVNE